MQFLEDKVMAKKKNLGLIRLISTAGTGVFYVTKACAKKSEPMRLRKYDKKIRAHVEFKEAKMK